MTTALGRIALVAFSYFSPSTCEAPSELGALDLSSGFGTLQPFVHRRPSFVRYQDPPPDLFKRDCLANGTNYCFGDTANYCTSCGTCCSDGGGKWCCPSNGVCCGSACCASGQTCQSGKCFLPPVTQTVSSIVVATVTHQVTNTDTVAHVVFETSTVNSVVVVTVTNAGATETDWVYVTSTAIEKRSLPSPFSAPLTAVIDYDEAWKAPAEPESPPGTTLQPWDALGRLAPPPAEQATLARRQEQPTRPASASADTTTVTVVVSQTSDVTNFVHNTITTDSTSIVLTTIFQTNTKVVSAQTTVQATSTLVFTSRLPVTSTTTYIATNPISAATSSSPSATATLVGTPPPDSPTGLSTPTIIGVAVGSTVFALLVCAIVFALIKWRQRKARLAQQYEETYYGLGGHNSYIEPGRGYGHMSARQPALPQFAVAAPAHHRVSHGRTESGFTGSTTVAAGGVDPKAQRVSAVSSSAGGGGGGGDGYAPLPVEVPADDIQRFEVDGASTAAATPSPYTDNAPWPSNMAHMDNVNNVNNMGNMGNNTGGGRGEYYRDF